MPHRRTNSYSYSISPVTIQPPSLLAKRETQHSPELLRNTEDRRSYRLKVNNSGPLSANKGYRSVTVSLAVPGQIRYSTATQEEEEAEGSMYRPRSPSKLQRTGVKVPDITVPGLDNTLADIKEQLLLMKKERNEIVDRLDNLLTGIQDTQRDLRLKVVQAQKSPAQSLRRIHSLEGRGSTTNLDTISDCSSSSSINSSPSSTHVLQRVDSLPSGTFNTIVLNSSPNIVRRNSSRKGSPRVLPTIPDTSIFSCDEESSSDESSQISPFQSTDSPLVGPLSPDSKILVQPRRSKYAWPTKTTPTKTTPPQTNYYTLPIRRSSTPNSPLHKVQSEFSYTNNTDAIWDRASVHSIDSSSMILQISSATGQLEKVPQPIRKQLFISSSKTPSNSSVENIQTTTNYSSLPESSRLSVSSYFIGPGFEDSDSMIMSLSEEPAPSRSNSISSIASSSRSNSVGSYYHRTNSVTHSYTGSNKRESITSSSLPYSSVSTGGGSMNRNSLVLNGKETTV